MTGPLPPPPPQVPQPPFVERYLVSELASMRHLGVAGLSEKLEYNQRMTYLMLYQNEKKNETTLLIVSLFLGSFGIDRFILGHTGFGLVKLFTLGGCGLFTIIDWFCIMGLTKEYNEAVAYKLFQQVRK